MTPSQEGDPEVVALMPTEFGSRLAWVGSLYFAIAKPEILAAFREDTGCTYTPSSSPIEQTIDHAAGADKAFLLEFIRWHNKWLWGEVNGRACNGDEPEFINAADCL